MAIAKININTDADTKREAEILFSKLGINMTTAINMFLHRAILERGLPFEVSINVPNADTRAAMIEVADMKAHPENYPSYKSVDELQAALEAE